MKCEICGKELSARGIKYHIWRKHTEAGKNHLTGKNKSSWNIGLLNKGKYAWNRGLTKESDIRIKKSSEALKEFYTEHENPFKGRHHTEEIKKVIGKYGGYRQGCGHGIKGWYKGFWCDSSWELAYVIYCLENNISIQRNTKKFKYIFEDKVFHYTPDYELNGQRYVEVKGYKTDKWKAKVEQFPCNLTIIDKDKIKPILEYVIQKYGKNFIKLYEMRG